MDAQARLSQLVAQAWKGDTLECVLDTDPELVPLFVTYLVDRLEQANIGDFASRMRISLALTETLDNALHHGNLELSSELRQGDGQAWVQVGAERRATAPYKNRKIYVRARVSPQEFQITVRDEGPGFDPKTLPDPTQQENLEEVSGRGVLLMRSFMDAVEYNATGNQVTLRKSFSPAAQ